MYDCNCNELEECCLQQDIVNKVDFLIVYGLWFGLLKFIVVCGVDECCWMCYGCVMCLVFNMLEVKVNCKCQVVEIGLLLEMVNKFNNVMLGLGGIFCLECYEYVKYGVCFGFDFDSYFGVMV